ncbi:MAG: hypothetical protein ACREML_05475, partial [Vulcanimicrobiaceae bacterium]
GTMALDIASYMDVAVRGRSSSGMPAEVIRCMAVKAGVRALSASNDDVDDSTKNRRSALVLLCHKYEGKKKAAKRIGIANRSDNARVLAPALR